MSVRLLGPDKPKVEEDMMTRSVRYLGLGILKEEEP